MEPLSLSRRGVEALIALFAVAVAAALWVTGWLPAVERATGDLLLRAAGTNGGEDPPMAVVLIDDESVAAFGPLPWSRSRLARLVDSIREAGAKAVVIDLILSEPTTDDEDLALGEAVGQLQTTFASALDADGAWLLPLDAFGGVEVAAHAYGEVGPDGVVRTIAATKQAHGLSLAALSLAAARMLRPELLIAPGAELRPAFQPAPQRMPAYSAAVLLESSLPAASLRDLVVFIGISATGAGDQFVVPTGPRHTPVPGVLAHASAASSILSRNLIRTPGTLFMLISGLALSLAVQVLRGHRGTFDFLRFTALVVALGVLAIASLRLAHIMVPAAFLFSAMVVSALLREAVESRAAQLESGRLLQGLLHHVGAPTTRSAPRTARDRLQTLRQLQGRVFEEDTARQALLTGMEEGVVLWDHGGRLVQANSAARRLWGEDRALEEIIKIAGPEIAFTRHDQKDLALRITEVETGTMALIRDVTAELELERRRRDVQRLVAHELKTPLASISGFGETLERYELTSEEIHRVATMIRGETVRLQEMVSAFLDLERLEAGQWEEELELIEFGILVAERLDILRGSAQSKGQTIEFNGVGECPVRGVPVLLERVVDNLVGNAIKYSEEDESIEVVVGREDDRVVMRVSDHGPGIPEDSLPRLSERFYRVPGNSRPGAGLGLALVKQVADWHGGCMTIDSEVGVGSTFSVALPAREED